MNTAFYQSLFSHRRMPDLERELQANTVTEYEREYLATGLKSQADPRLLSPSSITQISKKLFSGSTNPNTESKAPMLTDDLINIKKQQNTGVSLMAFFYVRKFIQKIRVNQQRLALINENHLRIINDNSCDNQITLNFTKFNDHSGQVIRNVPRLFRSPTILKPINARSVALSHFIKRCNKQLTEWIGKIPQVHPESTSKLIWDYCTTIVRMILLIMIPLEISFQPLLLFDRLIPLTILLMFILVMDTLIRLNTIRYIKGQAVRDKWQILKLTFQENVLIDLIIIIPLLYFCIDTGDNQQISQLTLLGGFFQYRYINTVVQRSEESSYFTKPQKGTLSLVKLVTTLIYILHLFSCIWFLNSTLNVDSWIEFKGIDDAYWTTQYLEAFYFAIVTMLTIGYGDNVPKTWNEKLLAIMFVMLACLWFSYSVNTIGTIIKEITQNKVERSKKIRIINRYMHRRHIPYGLQYKIREYLNFRWKEQDEIGLEQEQTLLQELSDELKEELDKQAHEVYFKQCEFLKRNFSAEFQVALSEHINRKIILPQNHFSIYSLSTIEQAHLCFIEQGQLQFCNEQKVSFNNIQSQGEFLQVNDFLVYNEHTQEYKAIGYVSLLILSKDNFMQTIKKYPKDYEKYCELTDSITMSIKQQILSNALYCPACKELNHQMKQCPQLRVFTDREVVIKRHLYSTQQPRQSSFIRKGVKGQKNAFQALPDKDIIEQFAVYYQGDQQKWINRQIQWQLVYEPEPWVNKYPPIARRQDSVQLSPNSRSNSPEQSEPQKQQQLNTPSNPMLNTLVANSFDLSSAKHSDSRVPQRRSSMHKYSIYKRRLQIRVNVDNNHTMSGSSVMALSSCKVKQQQEFNDMMLHNIDYLYKRAAKFNEDEGTIPRDIYLQIELLWMQCKHEVVEVEGFECVRHYDQFKTRHNVDSVIQIMQKSKHFMVNTYVSRLLQFMYYPYQFVTKYQKIKAQKLSTIIDHSTHKTPKMKMIDLKNKLIQKKFAKTMTIKFNSVLPQSANVI